jgi:hypothetical protein
MKLSRVLAITLLGAVAMTNTAMAKGTVAGTKITNTPTLTYSMGGTNKTLKAPTSAYVVDKVINFTVSRDTKIEHTVMVGNQAVAPYTITNIGNSRESFVVKGKQSPLKQFSFRKTQIFIDKNGNGVLDKSERVNNNIISKLKIDGKTKVWLAVEANKNTALKKRNGYGVEVRATAKGIKEIYTKQTVKNSMSKVDIVFADGKYGAGGDKLRDNRLIVWYNWTTVANTSNVKLTIAPYGGKIDTAMIVQHDPVNGMRRNGVSPKAIPGATVIKRWSIKNNTKTTAKNVKFVMKIDSRKEKFATNNKTTWWANKKGYGTQILWDSKKGLMKPQGVVRGNKITYTIPEIKPGQTVIPHMVLIVK